MTQGKSGEGALTVYSHLGLQVLSLPGVSETISFKDERREEGGRKGGRDEQKEGGSECTKKRLLSAELTQTCRVAWRNRHFSDGCKM